MLLSTVSVLVIMNLPPVTKSFKVGVIGCGAAGLAAARVFSRTDGMSVTVLEKDDELGGVWRHMPGDSTRPMYQGLRTNLPREIMAYREKPWGDVPGKRRVSIQLSLDLSWPSFDSRFTSSQLRNAQGSLGILEKLSGQVWSEQVHLLQLESDSVDCRVRVF